MNPVMFGAIEYAVRPHALRAHYEDVTATVAEDVEFTTSRQSLTRDVGPIYRVPEGIYQRSPQQWIIYYIQSVKLTGHVPDTRLAIKRQGTDEKAASSHERLGRAVPIEVRMGMQRLRRLTDGWAGEDSVAPNREAMADARTFLALAASIGLPEPLISATESGEVVFDWRIEGKKASARFDGDGSFGYALYYDGRYQPGREAADLGRGSLPEDLVDYLKSKRHK